MPILMLDANLSQSFVTDLPLLLKKAIDYLPSSPCQCLQDVCKTNKPNLTYVQGLLADKPNAALFANVLNLKLLHCTMCCLGSTIAPCPKTEIQKPLSHGKK